MNYTYAQLLNDKRQEGETYADYKERLRMMKKALKKYKQSRVTIPTNHKK